LTNAATVAEYHLGERGSVADERLDLGRGDDRDVRRPRTKQSREVISVDANPVCAQV
jgi:hypothetical protein